MGESKWKNKCKEFNTRHLGQFTSLEIKSMHHKADSQLIFKASSFENQL